MEGTQETAEPSKGCTANIRATNRAVRLRKVSFLNSTYKDTTVKIWITKEVR